jgi:hypothetical protein
MNRIQESPNTVKVELTEGCNLRCSFCGLNGIRGKDHDFKFMTLGTAVEVVSKLLETDWSPRFEFAMHGEPTTNPNICSIIRLFRNSYPKNSIMLTSNGSGIAGSKDPVGMVVDLFAAGFSTIALNAYQGIGWTPKIWELASNDPRIKAAGISMYRWPEDSGGNLHERRPNERRLIRLFAIDLLAAGVRPDGKKGNHARLANHTGSGAPKNLNGAGKKCGKPFREFAIRWDGKVALCCEDWRGDYEMR